MLAKLRVDEGIGEGCYERQEDGEMQKFPVSKPVCPLKIKCKGVGVKLFMSEQSVVFNY